MSKFHLSFSISGEAVPQGRPRFTTRGGFPRAYDPPKSRAYKDLVRCSYAGMMTAELYTEVFKNFSSGVFSLKVTEYRAIPKSWSKRRKEEAKYPVSKPDIDNVYKIVSDALNGIVWKDDSQVVHGEIWKKYSDFPRVDIDIEILEDFENDR